MWFERYEMKLADYKIFHFLFIFFKKNHLFFAVKFRIDSVDSDLICLELILSRLSLFWAAISMTIREFVDFQISFWQPKRNNQKPQRGISFK